MTSRHIVPPGDLIDLVAIPGKGRGVVATRAIRKGTLIEAAPVIRMKKRDRPARSSVLSHYPFLWDDPPYVEAFALGYAGLLNHSRRGNCWLEVDVKAEVIRIWAEAHIKPGDELTYDYGVDPWFEVET